MVTPPQRPPARAPRPAVPPPPRVRVSIRYKLLLVISAAVLLAVGAFVWLATSLFNRDKLAYVYDVNASLVDTLSEQTDANLSVLGQALAVFGREVEPARPGAAGAAQAEARDAAAAAEALRLEPDLVRVELWRPDGAGGWARAGAWSNPKHLEELGLRGADLELLRRSQPLPLAAIAAQPGALHVQNASLPPDAPLLTLALAQQTPSGPVVVAAEFRHDRLLRIFSASTLHETFLLDERGTVLAHARPAEVLARRNLSAHPLVKGALTGTVNRSVREFEGEGGVAMLGGVGRVDAGRLLVLTQITRAEALRAGHELVRRSLWFAAAVLLATIILSIFLSRVVTSPIRRLRAATEEVAQGRFDVAVDVRSGDEIGDLARSFVHMSHALRQAQLQLVRSEKLAAFGQLGAGITHELKNPLTGIVGFAQIAQRKLDDPEKIAELLRLIEAEGLRCRDILGNFLKFARQQSGRDTQRLDLNELAKSTVKMVSHQLSIHDVRLEVELGEGPLESWANGGELQQVLLNLTINAQQAMPGGGKVRLATRRAADGGVEMVVEDDGPGIPEELRELIFEPFFTTKAPGEGTGLGLAISAGIVRDHGGTLTVHSEVGRGTTFVIHLPAAGAARPGGEVVIRDVPAGTALKKVSHG